MMLDAFFVALAVFVGVAGHELLGMAMLSRPIVVAPLAGLLLGDVQTGLIVGASLESIFMGVVNIGISSTAEPALAAGLATAFAINLGDDTYFLSALFAKSASKLYLRLSDSYLSRFEPEMMIYRCIIWMACRRLSFAVCFSRRIDDCSGFAGSYVVFNPFKYNP